MLGCLIPASLTVDAEWRACCDSILQDGLFVAKGCSVKDWRVHVFFLHDQLMISVSINMCCIRVTSYACQHCSRSRLPVLLGRAVQKAW